MHRVRGEHVGVHLRDPVVEEVEPVVELIVSERPPGCEVICDSRTELRSGWDWSPLRMGRTLVS